MRGFAAQDAANGNQGVIAAGGSEFFRSQRQFKRAGDMNYVDVFTCCAGALEGIDSRSQQALGNKAVETAHDDAKAQAGRGEFTIDRAGLEFCGHR